MKKESGEEHSVFPFLVVLIGCPAYRTMLFGFHHQMPNEGCCERERVSKHALSRPASDVGIIGEEGNVEFRREEWPPVFF